GAGRRAHARGRTRGSPARHGSATASARATERGKRAFRATSWSSVPAEALLQIGERKVAEKLDLVLEPGPELLVSAPPRLGHQRERVGGGRCICVLVEVRMLRGYLGAARGDYIEPTGVQNS